MTHAPNDVPVFVDSVIALPEFPFVRCNYLSLERDAPDPGWALSVSGQLMPFLLLQLAGVVTQPFGEDRFSRVPLIEQLYAVTEAGDGLSLQVSDVWLPRFLFQSGDPVSGAVYRAGAALFRAAFLYREGFMDRTTFVRAAEGQALEYSASETVAFQQWHTIVMNAAGEQSPKNADLRLRRREGFE
jgi:hypothetical protein